MVILIGLFLALAGSTVLGDCSWKTGESIPFETKCNVPFGFFMFQSDGNAVIYDGNNKPLWNTQTTGIGHNFVFQGDGNLVMYSRGGVPVWNSNSANQGGESLVFQDDRNFVIYDKAFKPIWDAKTTHT